MGHRVSGMTRRHDKHIAYSIHHYNLPRGLASCEAEEAKVSCGRAVCSVQCDRLH